MRVRWNTIIALVFAALAAGCEQQPYGLAPVSGVVTLDGNPVPSAQISFQPQGGADNQNPGPGSTGTCDSAGRYELKTIRDEPGAVTGPHAVRIYGPKSGEGSAADTDSPSRKELFPPKYNFQTELSFDVPSEGTTSANFECRSE
jgi:hypothetical protein